MGLLLILAVLAAWHGLARVILWLVVRQYTYGSSVDLFFSHFISLMFLCTVIYIKYICNIKLQDVWRWLVDMR